MVSSPTPVSGPAVLIDSMTNASTGGSPPVAAHQLEPRTARPIRTEQVDHRGRVHLFDPNPKGVNELAVQNSNVEFQIVSKTGWPAPHRMRPLSAPETALAPIRIEHGPDPDHKHAALTRDVTTHTGSIRRRCRESTGDAATERVAAAYLDDGWESGGASRLLAPDVACEVIGCRPAAVAGADLDQPEDQVADAGMNPFRQ